MAVAKQASIWACPPTSKTQPTRATPRGFESPLYVIYSCAGERVTNSNKDGTSFWNGQNMERSELIPQTTANLGSGHLYYHFSLSTKTTNAPDASFEHQIAFFESHFTELKYGASGSSDNTLRWYANGQTHWSIQLEPGNWYNFAYDIDFASQKVGLWASNGSDPLTEVVSPVSASTSTNSADWHVGQLRLPNGGASNDAPEDWFWSGIYVEQAPITKEIGSPASSSSSSGSSSSTPSTVSSASNPPASTSSSPQATPQPSSTPSTEPTATPASQAVTTPAASAPATNVATPAESSPQLPAPTTAAQLLADLRAALSALLSRSNSVHARDFARRG